MSKETVFKSGQLIKNKNTNEVGVVVRLSNYVGQHIVRYDDSAVDTAEWSGNLVAIEKRPSVYTVEPGRTIAKDGVPYVYIGIQYDLDNNRSVSPTEADSLTHLIAKLLNEHFAKNA
jgi:hypothetical protein